MNRHDFDILLQKYLAGECTEEEAMKVELWSERMLEQRKYPLKNPGEEVKKRVWKRLDSDLLRRERPFFRFFLGWRQIAASVLVIGLVAFFAAKKSDIENFSEAGVTELQSSVAQEGTSWKELNKVESRDDTLRHLFPDGSVVLLGKNSKVTYPSKFASDKREVFLEGEAFFEVARDKDRPFYVFSGGLVTKVLGTSFSVRSSVQSGQVEVEVVSGSVSVYEGSSSKTIRQVPIVLTPNQKIVFEKATRKITSELVDEPMVLRQLPDSTDFVFVEAPLADVLAEISKNFEIDIAINSPGLEPCVFTGDLNGLPLHLQLNLICKSVNGNYEQNGNVYMIRGAGCAPYDQTLN